MQLSSFIRKHNINRNFVFFTLIALAVCFLYKNMFYDKKMKIISASETEEKSLNEEIVKISKLIGNVDEQSANLEKLKGEYERLKTERDNLFKKFPNKAEASRMLEEVVHEKNFSGINFESYYPSDEIPTNEGYFYIPIEVQVAGGFNKIGEYINYIENLPRIIIIEDVSFSVESKENVTKGCIAKLKGKTYVLKHLEE